MMLIWKSLNFFFQKNCYFCKKLILMKKQLFYILTFCLTTSFLYAQTDKSDWMGGVPEGCTSVTVGKKASDDGSVMTSHTDDSHRTRSEINMMPAQKQKSNTKTIYKRVPCNDFAMPTYRFDSIGTIPEVKTTFQYINSAYPCLNDHQVGTGESTFGGRSCLQSDNGLIDCTQLCQLMMERCTTARHAIETAGLLIKTYGWIDEGECLTIADPKEVWHFEVVGPGKGKKGGIWVAQRVPDDHIAVNANASTIKHIDLSKHDYFMASENVYKMALDSGWCTSKEDFQFCYAYAPESRQSVAARRREWRVFDLVAPSLKLDPNDKDYPFSVKPDQLVSKEMMVRIFKDYYEGTPYDMTRTLTVKGKDGKEIISPLANPQMPYDQLELEKVRGGWFSVDDKTKDITFLGERSIARWYTMYATIIQLRDWLPNEVGGVVWLALDNVATSIYIPIYPLISHLPKSYETPGRPNGYTMESAWWAFNRLSTLTHQRWGDMRYDVDAVFVPWQQEMFDNQGKFEKEIVQLLQQNKKTDAVKKMTEYTNFWGEKVVKEAWRLGDFLWTKYDEKF